MQKLESLEAVHTHTHTHTGDLKNKKIKYNQGKIVSIFKNYKWIQSFCAL